MSNKIKVLLHYIVYPMAIGTYFRKAFEHRSDVDLKVCGPYTSTWIPWMGGMTLPKKYDFPPDVNVPYPPNIGEYNYEIIHTQLGDWHPDLVVQIDAGLHFKYKPVSGMTVTVGTDPHVFEEMGWYDNPRKYSDKFFNMQAFYSKPGDIYLPYAYSTYDHFPDDTVSKDTDAVLIGMPYENRVQWVDALRRKGVSVIFENGPVFDDARRLYNRGRIGLSWSSKQDLIARVFELPAMKLYSVVNEVPDLIRFRITGDIFHNLDEAVEQVVWAKEHPVDAQQIAELAYQNVQGETYDARVETILKECGFVS
jgi:hypothetical protein